MRCARVGGVGVGASVVAYTILDHEGVFMAQNCGMSRALASFAVYARCPRYDF